MNKKELMIDFFVKKDYEKLKEILNGSASHTDQQYLARVYLEEKEYKKAGYIYKNLGMIYEYGRCELLSGELEHTKELWRSIKEENPAILWGRSLLEFINLYVINIPTFFQIRAFLEVDLDALLNANLIEYCENIANGAHLFARNNQESYKFIGRVFINNGYYDLAGLFLQKAKDVCYIDPEVHFMIAKCHIHNNEIKKAKESLLVSMEKGYGYYPAKKMLKELESMH